MTKPDEFYTIFEDAFISWAEEKDDIRAAFIVGSRARMDHPADEWSDLDIIIYAKDHKTYLSDTDWLENIGNVWITFTYHTASGQPERLILFEGSFRLIWYFFRVRIYTKWLKTESRIILQRGKGFDRQGQHKRLHSSVIIQAGIIF